MSHGCSVRSLASATRSIPDPHGTPLRCLVVALCHGDPGALDQQGQALHMLQQFIDGAVVGMGQLKALDLGLGGS